MRNAPDSPLSGAARLEDLSIRNGVHGYSQAYSQILRVSRPAGIADALLHGMLWNRGNGAGDVPAGTWQCTARLDPAMPAELFEKTANRPG
jgi:hypothetical protein